jgi:hypothetical protein
MCEIEMEEGLLMQCRHVEKKPGGNDKLKPNARDKNHCEAKSA